MMREYIFCSVIESPQMARRSPCLRYKPVVGGALAGLNFCSSGEACWAVARRQTTVRTRAETGMKLIFGDRRKTIMARLFGVRREASRWGKIPSSKIEIQKQNPERRIFKPNLEHQLNRGGGGSVFAAGFS